ncbi:MAG: tetratricopeptide repeat protein [Deltaproteobacteria bacterium]|nr:tetratricopeptide repeat protein [Deltaproteobacteria bacterium]
MITRRPAHTSPALVSTLMVGLIATLFALTGCSLFGEEEVPEAEISVSKVRGFDGNFAPVVEEAPSGPSAATVASADVPEVEAEPAGDLPALVALPSTGAAPPAEPKPEPLALIHPDDPEVDHLLEAETALSDGDAATALLHFRRSAFDLDDFESFEGIGRAARAAGERELALRAFEAAAEKDDELAEPLVAAARIALGLKQYKKGLQLIDQAIAREPRNAEAFNVRGRLWMSKQQYQKALIAFDRSMDLDPAYIWAYNNAGYIHLVTGEYQEAADLLEVATTLEPAKAYMFNNLGLAYEKLGRVEEARQTFVKALDLRPGYVNAHLNLSRVKTRIALATPPPGSASEGGSEIFVP